MKYPNRIRELREAKGLSQQQLANAAHTTNQQISRLETGQRRLSQGWMDRLAQALGCDTSEFLPSSPVITEKERNFLNDLRQLTEEQQSSIHSLMQTMKPR